MDETDDRPPIDWAAVRVDYEANEEPVLAICARYGVTKSQVSWRVRTQLWKQRNTTSHVGRPQIIKRMFRVLELQLLALEGNMEHAGEKEVAVLGKLASTLEKLIDIDHAAARVKKPAAQRKDIQELRNKLAERIAQLKRV